MKDTENKEEIHERGKFRPNAHIIILALIALVFITAVWKLLLWNRGEKIIIDPNEDTSQFDVETEDYIMYLDARQLEGHEDDGKTTVLCLGNDPFASDRSEKGAAGQLAKLLDADVYNCAFKGSTLSAKNSVYDAGYVNDAFSLYWLTKSITLQDFTLLDNSVDAFENTGSDSAGEALDTLKKVDMDKVDVLTIMYDGSDYLEDRIVTSPYDLSDIGTCSGALKESLALLRKTYPYIRILVLSPTFACQVDENGNYLPGSTTDTPMKNGFLSDYMIAYKNIAVDSGVTFIDNYNGTITEGNYKEYLKDNIQLNEKGSALVARRVADILIKGPAR